MYVFGIFFGRHNDERIKIKLDSDVVKTLVKTFKKDRGEFEIMWEEYTERIDTNIRMYVVLSALYTHIVEGGDAKGTFVCDDEEWLLAFGKSQKKVKKAYSKAEAKYPIEEECGWEE